MMGLPNMFRVIPLLILRQKSVTISSILVVICAALGLFPISMCLKSVIEVHFCNRNTRKKMLFWQKKWRFWHHLKTVVCWVSNKFHNSFWLNIVLFERNGDSIARKDLTKNWNPKIFHFRFLFLKYFHQNTSVGEQQPSLYDSSTLHVQKVIWYWVSSFFHRSLGIKSIRRKLLLLRNFWKTTLVLKMKSKFWNFIRSRWFLPDAFFRIMFWFFEMTEWQDFCITQFLRALVWFVLWVFWVD